MSTPPTSRGQRRAGQRALRRAQRRAYVEDGQVETWTCGWPRCREVKLINGSTARAQVVALEHYRDKHGGEQP